MDVKTLATIEPWEWPQNAGKLLHRALSDRRTDARERMMAAEMAGDMVVVNDELAKTLMQIVTSAQEPDDLRGRAAISLGPVLEQADLEIDDIEELPISEDTLDKIIETLESVYQDRTVPKEVRRRVLEASVRYSQPWHRAAVKEAYNSGDEDWKLTAVFSMRYVRGFSAEILEALNSPDEKIKIEAVQAAGAEGLEQAWPQVSKWVRSKGTPRDLLLASIAAAASVNPPEAFDLLEPLTSSRDEEISEAAEEAIGMAEINMKSSDEEDDDIEAGGTHWVN